MDVFFFFLSISLEYRVMSCVTGGNSSTSLDDEVNVSVPNISDTCYPNEIWILRPEWEVAVKSTALAPIVLFGIFGNVTLLVVIIKSGPLKNPTNTLIINMAITDVLTLGISSWMFLVRDIFQNYILGEFACKLEGFLEFSFLLTGVFNLVLISYNRLMAIVSPHEVHLTAKSAKISMGAAWIFGFVVATPLIIFRNYNERQWKDFFEQYCVEDAKVLPMYWNVIISLMIWIPLGIMLLCYSAIFYKLDKYQKQVLKRKHPINVNYKKKVARTLFIVVIVFILCRVPFTAVVFWRSKLLQTKEPFAFGESFTILWFTCHYLMFTNAALNPLIYGLTNESFRKAFQRTPMSRWLFSKKATEETEADKKRKIWTLQPKESSRRIKFRFDYSFQEKNHEGDSLTGVFKFKEKPTRDGILYM